jgi:hypothetical protein
MTERGLLCKQCGAYNAPKAGFCSLCHDPLVSGVSRPDVQAFSGNTIKSGNTAAKPTLQATTMLLFTDAERHNVRMSYLLFAVLFGIFALLGAVIGKAFGDVRHDLAWR